LFIILKGLNYSHLSQKKDWMKCKGKMEISLRLIVILFFTITCNYLYAQQVFINEIMSSNGITIADEDNDYSDWLEIYNAQESSVDLNGYGLSDDASTPFKWIFPQVTLAAKDHLLVFASDKNRTEYIRHWETVIDWGDVWKYRLGTSEPPAAWKNIEYDDLSWSSGASGFGFGDNDDATIVPSTVQSVYVRKTFTLTDASIVKMALLHVDYDDAFVAYLNGSEIARKNIGTVGTPPTYNQSATNFTEPLIVYGGRPETFVIENFQSLLKNGNNVLAIQVHNYGTGSSDLTLIPFLTLGLDEVPSNPQGVNPLLDLFNKYLHTNFKLSSDGESLLITNPQGTTVDQINFGVIGPDLSYGRKPDGSNNWFLFEEATPGDSNKTDGIAGITSVPKLSVAGGFYQAAQSISLTPSETGDVIHYTLDGSEPNLSSPVYTAPIQIRVTTVLRVKSFAAGFLPSKTLTNTYFINFSSQLPVVSLSTNPGNLFNEEYGIYTMGDSAEASFPYFGANFWKDWERPIHVEIFEKDRVNGFSADAGIKIFGAWSRGNSQKSFAIFARGQYGSSVFNYKLFDDLPFVEYESFVLRNSGNDWSSTMFRDALMTGLFSDVDLDIQAYRPTVVFLNGAYWGILNLREKVNEHFLAQHNNVIADSLDILENDAIIVEGDSLEYLALYSFLENNSMAVPSNYEYVKSKMEIDNFIKYQVAQIYIANNDWPGNNIKYWKKKTNGKWRWILFDTDFGFGLFDNAAYTNNSLQYATAANGPNYPNPPWGTLFLRKLLVNNSFRYDFINCYADFANSILKPEIVVNKINELKSIIEPEMPRHIAKWNQFNINQWESNVQVMREFASQRLNYMNQHFLLKFNLSGMASVNLAVADTSSGSVKLNSLNIKSTNWTGNYFLGIPVNLIAQPKKGFRFSRWEGSSTSTNDSLKITLIGGITLKAVFEIDSSFSDGNVVINEINYNSSPSFNTEDWIELYNNSVTAINISNWIFKDSDDSHIYTILQGTILQPNNYLVLCIDTSLFKPLFSDVKNFIGNVGFGLSGSGELIRLYDNEMNLVDSVEYDDAAPWPTQPDGNGSTLSLKNPDLDNARGVNWLASVGNGTPGKINDIFTGIENENNNLIPTEFALYQNYPNPFNPSTTVRYSIPTSPQSQGEIGTGLALSVVTLKIYDLLGNEVATLVNEQQYPGTYEVEFNLNAGNKNLTSGVYFYRLKAGDFTETKKCILLK